MNAKYYPLIIAFFLSFITLQPSSSINPRSCLLFTITSQNIARIGVINRENDNLVFLIKNEYGEVLFTKSVTEYDDYFKLFDLSGMPDGEYIVKLTGGKEPFEKKFTVENKTATLIKEKKEIKPVFKLINEDILIVSYLNAKMNTVNIFFELDDDVVFEERNIKGNPVSKKYSLKKLPHGEYLVKLYSGGNVYEYPLAVK
ncbi:MAG: hypothetical protein PVF73_06690 [Bacteroidales bacterium]|jgi:hypothetical protein